MTSVTGPEFTREATGGRTDNQTGKIMVDNELRAEERRDRSHIDMPPIGA